MTEHAIESTADFRQVWPDLPRTNKFKRGIDQIFANGNYIFTLKLAGEGRHFNSKSGKAYSAVIYYQGAGRCLQRKVKLDGQIQAEPISWAAIGREIGQLVKEEFVHLQVCSGCRGTGYKPHFAHVANGLCFDCMGIGKWFEVKAVANPGTVTFSRDFIKQYSQPGYCPKVDESTEMISCICNEGHATAEKWIMKKGGSYIIGQPVCQASIWYMIPAESMNEFIKHYNKVWKTQIERTF
jgi:hypothetical protein